MDKSLSLHTYTQLKSFQAQYARIGDKQVLIPQDQEPKLCTSSRKILKKRSRYNKINDEIRLKLIEAVEKNGEMLKSVSKIFKRPRFIYTPPAKKFKVNYSSAKSIFQTYRKEGRVLRKTNKTRRPSRQTSLIKTESTRSKIEETSPVRSQTDTPLLDTHEHSLPQLKPLQHYLSPPKPQTSSLDNLGQLLTGVDFTIKRNVDELKRLLAPTYPQIVSPPQLRNETGLPLLGQGKIGALLDSYSMMQPQFSPSQSQAYQSNYHNLADLLQTPQYPYLKNYQEGVRMDTLNLLMKQLISSRIGPTLP